MSLVPKTILVLYWHPEPLPRMRPAIYAHLHVMDSSEVSHDLSYWNAFYPPPNWLRRTQFDAVILHTTFLCMRWAPAFYVWKWQLRWVASLDCLKLAMPQDEYDHSEVLDEWLYEWGVSVVFSNFDPSYHVGLYPLMHRKASFYKAFTGYIDEQAMSRWEGKQPALKERPVDIVYRASRLPYWFGNHGQMKSQIADRVAERASERGMKCDISTRPEDTIVGDRWEKFLASGRAIIGCESGSSVLDRRGEIKALIQVKLQSNPTLSYEQISQSLPKGWDSYKFFAIGPRHFEAVVTKTCQVLIEGHYDGVFEADRHYIPLKRDYSNLEEVLDKLEDIQLVSKVVDQAYADICLSDKYSYRAFAAMIDRVLSETTPRRAAWHFRSSRFFGDAGRVLEKVNNGRLAVRGRLKELIR